MTMSQADEELLAALVDSSWERMRQMHDIGGVAGALLQAGIFEEAARLDWDYRTLEDEILDALDEIDHERTARISINWKE